MRDHRAPEIHGRQLLAWLAIIALLAFVVPPAAAVWLQRSRTARAQDQLIGLARTVTTDSTARSTADVDVLVGAGDVITRAADPRWVSLRTAPLLAGGMAAAPDPWMRPFMINVGAARSGGRLVVVSSGANGILETDYLTGIAGGDDLVVPLPAPKR